MRGLLAGLAICLLAALLLVLVDGAGRENSHPAANWLQDAQRALQPSGVTGGSSSTLTPAEPSGSLRSINGGGRIHTVRLGGSDCAVVAGSPIKAAILSSVSIGFQGAVVPREQSALLGSFVPRTRIERCRKVIQSSCP